MVINVKLDKGALPSRRVQKEGCRMITKIVCALIGAVIMLVAIMVISCCKLSGFITRRAERWSDDE